MKIVTITTEFIKLQDLLKLADAVSTGGEAKIEVQEAGKRRYLHPAGQENPPRRHRDL